jgi:hypothetical protein
MSNPIIRTRKRPPASSCIKNALAEGGSLHDNLRLHVEYRDPATLKPPKRILRKHSPRQIEQIKASITAHGFLNPILVDGDQRIVCGHEVDLDEGLWQIPIKVGRGREGRVHVVPLSKPMIDVLERARKYKRGDTDLVFRGVMRGKQLSKDTLWQVPVNMGYPITAQGFHRTFAEWVDTKTTFPREVREAALGHANPYKAEGVCAYLEERRALMEAWGSYCLGADGGLVDRSFLAMNRSRLDRTLEPR